jgi:hypothetical protein
MRLRLDAGQALPPSLQEHQGHAQNSGVEVHGGFHVIGVEGQVVNAPAGGTQVVGGAQGGGHGYLLDLRKWL